ncbi:hypothetical protein ElyMa_005220800 [Elysia marginata]|uniref:Uncharacterized protein n=1 Tax=Elysia marginata TaxID=1093978 RepID=A0AAV4JV15_9GAST|nr:hypothetical protein ElyMa_005220800 [Elysia marginata]
MQNCISKANYAGLLRMFAPSSSKGACEGLDLADNDMAVSQIFSEVPKKNGPIDDLPCAAKMLAKDMLSRCFSPEDIETVASYYSNWRAGVKIGVNQAETNRETRPEERKELKQQRIPSVMSFFISYSCTNQWP